MIRLLEDFDGNGLRQTHRSLVIKAHLQTYGCAYDFCRFYEIKGKKRVGVAVLLNGACTVELCEGVKPNGEARRELSEFLDFSRPISVELPDSTVPRAGFTGYSKICRSFFEIPPADSADGLITPEPERVFKTAFYGSADYGLWLTDTLRRVNLGSSRLIGYKTSVLTVRYMLNNRAYVTDVATPYEDRGKGYARTLLGKASRLLADMGFTAYLCATPDTAGFYRYLSYKELGSDFVFNLKKQDF